MAIDATGLPSITFATADFTDAEKNLIRDIPDPPQVSFGNIVDNILRGADNPMSIVIDTANRKIYADMEDAYQDNIATAGGALKSVTLTPDANQTGRSLEWTCGAAANGFTSAYRDDIAGTVAAVKQSRSVASLVNAILAVTPETGEDPFIVVDQTAGEVKVIVAANRAAVVTALNAEPNPAAEAIKISLSEPAAGGVEPLIFEGGAT